METRTLLGRDTLAENGFQQMGANGFGKAVGCVNLARFELVVGRPIGWHPAE